VNDPYGDGHAASFLPDTRREEVIEVFRKLADKYKLRLSTVCAVHMTSFARIMRTGLEGGEAGYAQARYPDGVEGLSTCPPGPRDKYDRVGGAATGHRNAAIRTMSGRPLISPLHSAQSPSVQGETIRGRAG
jgi:hypothetical protein